MRARRTVLGLVAVLALGACGSSKDSASSPAAQRGEVANGKGLKVDTVRDGTGPGAVAATAAVARSVVRTATMTVRVRDVDAAARAAVASVERAGGFLEAESSRLDEATTLTLRVPPERFTPTLDEVAKLGTVAERQVTTEDVTESVADVEGRLAAARASTKRLRGLLDGAGSFGDITQLEGELSSREGEIESLQARRRALSDETSFATLSLTIQRPPAPVVAAHPRAHVGGFMGGLRVGWAAFTGLVSAVLIVSGVLLPFAVTAGALGVPLVLYLRRKRGRYSASTP
jgi:hypothetical protein